MVELYGETREYIRKTMRILVLAGTPETERLDKDQLTSWMKEELWG